jgi:hypothetical protein
MTIKPIKIWILLTTILLISCQGKKGNSDQSNHPQSEPQIDTVVGSKAVINEIAGSAYRRKAKSYFLVTNYNDTSVFNCIVTESNEGAVGIELNLPYRKTLTYRQRMNELEKLLPAAARDFNFDSLQSVSLGRLVLSGDLAVDVTEQFMESGYDEQLPKYDVASLFVKESILQDDLNRLFAPYSIEVDRVSIEKLFYTTKKELLNLNVLEKDTAIIPSKIVDCITWVRLKRVR